MLWVSASVCINISLVKYVINPDDHDREAHIYIPIESLKVCPLRVNKLHVLLAELLIVDDPFDGRLLLLLSIGCFHVSYDQCARTAD